MTLQGVTVAVVFGSRSVEHEISVITACQVMPLLQELGAEVVPLYITKQGSWITKPSFRELRTFRGRLPEAGDPVLLDLTSGRLRVGGSSILARPRDLTVDVLFPILHGTFGEDGTLAGLAAMARIPQVGCDTLSSALGMDKLRSKRLFHEIGLPVVPGRGAAGLIEAREAAGELGFPLVVKPNRGGSSIGVALANGPAELEAGVRAALEFDDQVLLESAVPGASDLNCAVKLLEPRFSEVERPIRSQGVLSYTDKYANPGKSGGGSGAAKQAESVKAGYGDPRRELPAAIPEATRAEVQRLAVAAFDALGCSGGTARVDFLLSETGDLYLNEVNTIPGSLAFYLWAASGISFPVLLEELVQEAMATRDQRTLSFPENLLSTQQLLGKSGPNG
ncbi:MAG TPA: D-alanine--D-alanine ligase family protein [Candidatus Dormibacteraeota bacterium]|nr:D-alanine--D-alanine ligase family protein [Candidatus Dormibacteraeota bacterium]